MRIVRTQITPISPTNRSAVSNRSRMLEGVDGRSAGARRFRDLVNAYEAELGGVLSEAERSLVRQAVGLQLQAERMQGAIVRGEPVDSDALIRVSSTSKRLLAVIAAKAGKRKPTDKPNLKDYLAAKAAAEAAT